MRAPDFCLYGHPSLLSSFPCIFHCAWSYASMAGQLSSALTLSSSFMKSCIGERVDTYIYICVFSRVSIEPLFNSLENWQGQHVHEHSDPRNFQWVLHDLSEPKAARYTPPAWVQWRCSIIFLSARCVDDSTEKNYPITKFWVPHVRRVEKICPDIQACQRLPARHDFKPIQAGHSRPFVGRSPGKINSNGGGVRTSSGRPLCLKWSRKQ